MRRMTQPEARRRHPRTMLLAPLDLATMRSVVLGTTSTAQADPRDGAAKTATAEPTALSAPISGTLPDGTGSVDGLFNITTFAKRNGQLVALGEFTGTVTDAAGNVVSGSTRIAIPVDTVPVTGAQRQPAPVAATPLSGQPFDLVLGPLDLNLLGPKVHLDVVKLNRTAQSGPGNLLGILLCAGKVTNQLRAVLK